MAVAIVMYAGNSRQRCYQTMQESTLQIGALILVLFARQSGPAEVQTPVQVPAVAALASIFVSDKLATRILPSCSFF
jgi:hypothetical protein